MTGLLSPLESVLLTLAIGGYFATTLGLWAGLLLRPQPSAGAYSGADARAVAWSKGSLVGAIVLHAAALVGQGGALLSVRAGVVGLFGWLLAFGAAAALLNPGSRPRRAPVIPAVTKSSAASLGAFAVPIALVAATYSLLTAGLHPAAPDVRALEVPFIVLHVTLLVGAYVSLAWAFAVSLVYLLEEWLLKHKRLPALWEKLPPLRVADTWIYRATLFGAGLLTLGIATGAAWYASRASQVSPLHDPKVIVSLLTWAVFATALGARWMGWRGRRVHLVVVCGFVLLAISFLTTPHWLNAR